MMGMINERASDGFAVGAMDAVGALVPWRSVVRSSKSAIAPLRHSVVLRTNRAGGAR